MKKAKILPALLFVLAGVGCNPTDTTAPTINSLNVSLSEAYLGETVSVTYDVEDNVTTTENLDVSLTLYYSNKEEVLTSNSFTVTEAVPYSVLLLVKDEAGNETSKTVSVSVSNQYSWTQEQNEAIKETLGISTNPFPLLKEFGEVTLEDTTNMFGTVSYYTVEVNDVDDPKERLGSLLEIAGFTFSDYLSGETGEQWTDKTPVIASVYTLDNQFENVNKVVEASLEYNNSSRTFYYIIKNYVYPTVTASENWNEDAINTALSPISASSVITEFSLENPTAQYNYTYIDMHEEYMAPVMTILVNEPTQVDVTNFVNNMFTTLPDYNDGSYTVDEIVQLIMEDEYGYTFMVYIFDDSGSMIVPMIQVYFSSTEILQMDIVCMIL